MIGTFGPWGQGSEDSVEIPTVSASSFQIEIMTGVNNDSTELAAVTPPYIILGDLLDQREPLFQQSEIRVSIGNTGGFYSDAMGSSLVSNVRPVMLTGSGRLAGSGQSPLDYSD